MGLKVGSLERKHVAVMRRVVMQIIWHMKEKRREESGEAHGWVLGSRNSCEHMCFLPFVLCPVGPFFMLSHLHFSTGLHFQSHL